MKNVKNIALVTLLSLIMTSGIATMAGTDKTTGEVCQGSTCNSGTIPAGNTSASADLNSTIDIYSSTYSSAGASAYSDAYSNANANSNAQGGNASSNANGGTGIGYGGTGVGYGGDSSAYNGGNSIDRSGNSTNIISTEGGAGGKATSDATAFGGNQQQGQLQGQVATGGDVKNSGNSDNTNVMAGGNSTNKNSSTNSTTVNTGNTEVANKTITYDKKGYDLPAAAPAIAPVVVGQMGTTGVSGAVSTPFGGISGGFSKTNKEGKDLMKAQAEALRVQADAIEATTEGQVISQDIQNLKDADTLSDEDKAVVKEFILRKYRK
jgi:hypothetical protein